MSRETGFSPVRSAAVITPSVGHRCLPQCLASVQAQDYPHIEHFVVADGPAFAPAAQAAVANLKSPQYPVHFLALPENTGGTGLNGYRIEVAFAQLVNADVVFFLDDDNWYDASHVSQAMAAMNEFECEWAFNLRRICREDGRVLTDDNCDSLGYWRRDASYGGPSDYLPQRYIHLYSICPFQVDTSCFAMRRTTFNHFSSSLLQPYHGDAVLASQLARSVAGACTGARTLNYRLRKNQEDLLGGYYEKGNASMKKRYRDKRLPDAPFPWLVRQRCEPYWVDNLPEGEG